MKKRVKHPFACKYCTAELEVERRTHPKYSNRAAKRLGTECWVRVRLFLGNTANRDFSRCFSLMSLRGMRLGCISENNGDINKQRWGGDGGVLLVVVGGD